MQVTVIGCGRWGTFIAWYLSSIGHTTLLYGKKSASQMQRLISERKNDLIEIGDDIILTTDIEKAVQSKIIIISVGSQNLKGLMEELKQYELENRIFVLCMKGLEIGSGKRLSEIVNENTAASNTAAVWIGPGHVQEFYRGVPNCMVIDSSSEEIKKELITEFSSDLIRFYLGDDLLGNEIGAASKNVIGIAAGMLDGLGISSLKGALMSRGTREIGKLIKVMGGKELSAYGLCHLGDYEATVFSKYSHNRMFGESFIRGENFTALAEGFYTADAMMTLSKKYNVELPICEAVYNCLYHNKDAKTELNNLFSRSLKSEFI